MFEKIKEFFSNNLEDNTKTFEPRYKNIDDVKEFLVTIDEAEEKIMNKWFHLVNKSSFLEDPFVFDNYKIMEEQFNIFVDGLYVVNNCTTNNKDQIERIEDFIQDFKYRLEKFENIITSSVFSKIIDTGNKRNEISAW